MVEAQDLGSIPGIAADFLCGFGQVTSAKTPRAGAKPLLPQIRCLFGCVAKQGFRSLIFDIQGVFTNLWCTCLRWQSSVEFLESTGQLFRCEFGCVPLIKLIRWALISLSQAIPPMGEEDPGAQFHLLRPSRGSAR